MTGGGGGLSKLGTALVIIFVLTVVVLLTQFFYALWRRRVFRRRASTVGGGDEASRYSFCIRPQFALDRNALTPNSGAIDLKSDQQSDVEVIDIDLLKIQGMFGPPRFLFTISEEEREELESPARISLYPASEEEEVKKNLNDENGGGVSFGEYLRSAEESAAVVAVDVIEDVDDVTPFSTPCASPVYFTPSASPVHVVVNGRSTGESLVVSV